MTTSTSQRTRVDEALDRRSSEHTDTLDPATLEKLMREYELPDPTANTNATIKEFDLGIEEQYFELPMALDEVRQMHAERRAFFAVRRVLDIVTALAVLVVALPVMAIIAVAVRVDSGGPALFGHWRLGKEGVPFRCWKFRSMHLNADVRLQELLATDAEFRSEWRRDQKAKNDPRVTSLGEILRRTKLDELPQLFNVLVGQMSIIGPRPITEGERPRYGNAMPIVHTVRPGLTGPWQAAGTLESGFDRRVLSDVKFAGEPRLAEDRRVLASTARMMARDCFRARR